MSAKSSGSTLWAAVQRWRGVALVAACMVATIWLALTNQLVLYIHPRYIGFTVIMAGIALVFVVAGVFARGRTGDDHQTPPSRLPRALSLVGLAIAAVMAVAMVVLPPTTLSSATADQRDINSTSIGAEARDAATVASAPVGAFEKFTVVDWASLLRQTNSLDFYRGKPVDVVGFITADKVDPDNVFYVSRFVITCCAVDAQPAGIPVFYPNWKSSFAADQWVEAAGGFAANGSTVSTRAIALIPTSVKQVGQPSEPYLY